MHLLVVMRYGEAGFAPFVPLLGVGASSLGMTVQPSMIDVVSRLVEHAE